MMKEQKKSNGGLETVGQFCSFFSQLCKTHGEITFSLQTKG
jgi:hypothetical protein